MILINYYANDYFFLFLNHVISLNPWKLRKLLAKIYQNYEIFHDVSDRSRKAKNLIFLPKIQFIAAKQESKAIFRENFPQMSIVEQCSRKKPTQFYAILRAFERKEIGIFVSTLIGTLLQ